ncbi:hypothetical protein BG52_04365 [Paenibacillus darwinianus]|nr:hypothetical protein BG52_04365 [Paenibacillus darwinianus]
MQSRDEITQDRLKHFRIQLVVLARELCRTDRSNAEHLLKLLVGLKLAHDTSQPFAALQLSFHK